MSLQTFAAIVAAEEFSLAEAFLAFARAEYPDLDADRYLLELDRLGDGARGVVACERDPSAGLEALGAYLRGAGFAGETDDYYAPLNSFLNEVLDRRRGIPISLSVVWIETALRAGLPLHGVGMPMHFLVGLPGRDLYADPFDGGRVLSGDDAVLLFGRLTEGEVPWRDSYLAPTPGRDIVRRALTNLKAVYGAAGELPRALWVEDHLLAIPGTPDTELVERATVLEAMRRFPEAIRDLRRFLTTHPEREEEIAPRVRRLQAAMN